MLSRKATRKIVQAVLSYGLKFGFDMAGSFLGPAWPVVRPLVEKLMKGMPAAIAKKYKSSEEAVELAEAQLEQRSKELDEISKLLDEHGITAEWTQSVLAKLDQISDDMFEMVAQTAAIEPKLDRILAVIEESAEKKPGNLFLQGAQLEYVNFLRVPESAFPGFDLTSGSVLADAVADRHLPAGFMIYNFALSNWGEQKCLVTRIMLRVLDEYFYPDGSEIGELKPSLEPFMDSASLSSDQKHHQLFVNKRFSYNPEESDAFRIQLVFQKEKQQSIQQLQPMVYWSNSTGDHYTYGTPLFLASMPQPQLQLAKLKFGFG